MTPRVTRKIPEPIALSRRRGPGRIMKVEMDRGFCFSENPVLTNRDSKEEASAPVAMKRCIHGSVGWTILAHLSDSERDTLRI